MKSIEFLLFRNFNLVLLFYWVCRPNRIIFTLEQHWQRAFSFQKGKVFKGYLLGAAIFALVPLGMSIPGFIAAGNPGAAPAVYAGQIQAQQVSTEVIGVLLPQWGLILFTIMILSGLASTGDSALCAGGSMVAVDIYGKYVNPRASDKKMIGIIRLSILTLAIASLGIALIPGITILGLFLFYGTLRSSTFLPTILVISAAMCLRLAYSGEYSRP